MREYAQGFGKKDFPNSPRHISRTLPFIIEDARQTDWLAVVGQGLLR